MLRTVRYFYAEVHFPVDHHENRVHYGNFTKANFVFPTAKSTYDFRLMIKLRSFRNLSKQTAHANSALPITKFYIRVSKVEQQVTTEALRMMLKARMCTVNSFDE